MPAKKPRTSSEPQTLQEAILYFQDPLNTFAAMIKVRWPNGVTCPYCQSEACRYMERVKKFLCSGCRKQFSLKKGTIFEDSPLGLDTWFAGLWMITNAKNGISSCEIHRALGITQKSAWFLLHRLRLAMQEGTFEKLAGTVEVDETFIGGKAKNNKHRNRKKPTGTGVVDKAVVMGLLRRNAPGQKNSRVLTKRVVSTRRSVVHPEVRAHVEAGSALYTDSLKSYHGLDGEYLHQVVDHAVSFAEGHVHTNSMENFWSLLDRCLNGTYVSVDPDHLGRYVQEEAFRFNERADNDAGRFHKTLVGIEGKRVTYKQLTARPEGMPPRRGRLPRERGPLTNTEDAL